MKFLRTKLDGKVQNGFTTLRQNISFTFVLALSLRDASCLQGLGFRLIFGQSPFFFVSHWSLLIHLSINFLQFGNFSGWKSLSCRSLLLTLALDSSSSVFSTLVFLARLCAAACWLVEGLTPVTLMASARARCTLSPVLPSTGFRASARRRFLAGTVVR